VASTSRLAFVRRVLLAYAGFAVALAYCMARIARWRIRGAPPDEGALIARDTARVLARLTCRGGDITVRVVDGARIESSQPCVFVANHQSFVDYPILATIFPSRTAIVGKAQIGQMPLIGRLFRATGNVLLERDQARRAAETIAHLVKIVRAEDRSIWMFPEGTRRRTDEAMLPFKSGAFRVAAAAGVPIVPVVVSSLKPHIDLAQRQVEPTTVTIRVLPPCVITTNDEGTIRAAITATRAAMIAAYRDM
jgi:1-acyl-sn-glycerol-3-phosphate acyltransferase